MIQQFFIALIKLWLPDYKYSIVCKEALAFYYWLPKLKQVAFLPERTAIDRIWKWKQIEKCISKIPAFSPAFYKELNEIETIRTHSLTKPEWALLQEKRGRIENLVTWLHGATTENLETLQAMLLQNQPVKNFKRKRNTKPVPKPAS